MQDSGPVIYLEFNSADSADKYFELYESFIPWDKFLDSDSYDRLEIDLVTPEFALKWKKYLPLNSEYYESWKYVTLEFVNKYHVELNMHTIYVSGCLDLDTALKYQKQISDQDWYGGGWGGSEIYQMQDPDNTLINPNKLL